MIKIIKVNNVLNLINFVVIMSLNGISFIFLHKLINQRKYIKTKQQQMNMTY